MTSALDGYIYLDSALADLVGDPRKAGGDPGMRRPHRRSSLGTARLRRRLMASRMAVLSAPLGSGPIASGGGHSPWCRGGDGRGREPRSFHVAAKAVPLIGKVPRSVSVSSVDAEIATDANSPRRGTKPT